MRTALRAAAAVGAVALGLFVASPLLIVLIFGGTQ